MSEKKVTTVHRDSVVITVGGINAAGADDPVMLQYGVPNSESNPLTTLR